MGSEENKSIVRRSIEEIWGAQNVAGIGELFSTEYVGNFAVLPTPLRGVEALKEFASHYFTAFPDMRFQIEDLFGEEDRVVVRWSAQGTNTGSLMGNPPTGRKVTVPGMWIHRLDGNQIVEQWGINDTLGMLQQMGVIPGGAAVSS